MTGWLAERGQRAANKRTNELHRKRPPLPKSHFSHHPPTAARFPIFALAANAAAAKPQTQTATTVTQRALWCGDGTNQLCNSID